MDNASKALILAGGMLIGIMVIGVSFYVLTNARDFAKAANTQATIEAVQSFNRFYMSVINSNGKILGINVLNVYNKAIDDREQSDGRYSVTVNVDSEIIDGLKAPTGAELMDREFNYNITGFDSDGYITSIEITE